MNKDTRQDLIMYVKLIALPALLLALLAVSFLI